MQMIFCPNCQKRTGFRRALGFGTFVMVLITFGLWLLIIPLYPARCIVCGLQRQEAILTNLSTWWISRSVQQRVVVAVMAVCAAIGILLLLPKNESDGPAPIINGPDYNQPARTTTVTDPGTPTATTDRQLRLIPNASGTSAVEDGRTYSVGLIADTSNIPLGTQLFAQGKVARFDYAGQSRPFAMIEDDRQPGRTLLCAMAEEEGSEVFSVYHVGETVQASGKYMGNLPVGGNPAMPVLSDCHVASAQGEVVRPLETKN